jgi:hypothetical protein
MSYRLKLSNERNFMKMTNHNYSWARLALALGLLLTAMGVGAAAPRLEPLLEGKWPSYPRGAASDVKVVGSRAYLALSSGLVILDVSNPAKPVRLGGYDTSDDAGGVAVSGTVAYVADGNAGLQIIDVSSPASPVRLGSYDTGGTAFGVAVASNRIYVATAEQGLLVLCTVPNVQCMMRVEGGTLGTSYTVEAATNLNEPVGWTPQFTTNPAALPFEFTDFDVRIAAYPQKFYRVRQP